ncbi:MAG: hypothetical protein NT149_04055 [Candidatus Gottesmanbacteria bacterium]|nr:hypothetical protein [Candidatus Gottesmanbacteria bacterium]
MKKFKWMYITVLCVLTLVSFWRYLGFTFWKDDWYLVWGIFYNHLPAFRQFGYRPSAVIEFYWMTKLFGANALPWQITGLALRVCAALAFSFFATTLTSSSAVGLLSGVLAAGTCIGMDAVGWPSAHGVLITAIFFLMGLGYFVRYLHGKNGVWLLLGILYIGIAFVLDPFRMFPLFFIIPLLVLAGTISSRRRDVFRRILTIGGVGVAVSAVLGWIIFGNDIMASQLFSHLVRQPSFAAIVKKLYVIGNYFNSMANCMFGWLFRFPEDASTGVYNKAVARLGFLVFCIMVGMGYGYRKTKSKQVGMLLFSVLWMFLFYVPNWLFEPRLTMGVTHRYMVLSSFGFILAISYGLVIIRKRSLLIAGTVIFVASNMLMANYRTNVASAYRAGGLVNSLWHTIDRDVSKSKTPLIFVFEGEDPVKFYTLSLSGPSQFALLRGITDIYDTPIVTDDRKFIQQFLCKPNVSRTMPGAVVVQKDIIPLNHVYAWRVSRSGALTNISMPTRRELLISAMDSGCVPEID